MLLMANSVTVLMPTYRKILLEQYGRQNVHVRAHGILSYLPEYPDFSLRGNPVHRLLAFGKWGTYKRLEPMLQAFELIAKRLSNVKLVVAGGDHPRTPGYVASIAKQFASDPRVEFTGYVAEEEIPDLFRTATVAMMPYSSSTGSVVSPTLLPLSEYRSFQLTFPTFARWLMKKVWPSISTNRQTWRTWRIMS